MRTSISIRQKVSSFVDKLLALYSCPSNDPTSIRSTTIIQLAEICEISLDEMSILTAPDSNNDVIFQKFYLMYEIVPTEREMLMMKEAVTFEIGQLIEKIVTTISQTVSEVSTKKGMNNQKRAEYDAKKFLLADLRKRNLDHSSLISSQQREVLRRFDAVEGSIQFVLTELGNGTDLQEQYVQYANRMAGKWRSVLRKVQSAKSNLEIELSEIHDTANGQPLQNMLSSDPLFSTTFKNILHKVSEEMILKENELGLLDDIDGEFQVVSMRIFRNIYLLCQAACMTFKNSFKLHNENSIVFAKLDGKLSKVLVDIEGTKQSIASNENKDAILAECVIWQDGITYMIDNFQESDDYQLYRTLCVSLEN